MNETHSLSAKTEFDYVQTEYVLILPVKDLPTPEQAAAAYPKDERRRKRLPSGSRVAKTI